MNITYKPIGYFQSPYTDIRGMPIQPIGAENVQGTINFLPEFYEGPDTVNVFTINR